MLTCQEAVTGDGKDKYENAILEERESPIENNIWKEVGISESMIKKILENKWGFIIKDDKRYKARLVDKGFMQKEGIDTKELSVQL